ncbi:glycosyltransferase family 39 protein [Paenibacillus sp. y28]|uniref:glycosyltransferase family 39 protein n=1 Tax=Paenibacillus sp. y28 TaxID=3129110 RepID=UPI00301AF8A4
MLRKWKSPWDAAAMGLILLLSLLLNISNLGQEGYSNSYYAAAVRSMLQSWHNFFYASFDPAGFITVDKPPVALWVQTLSAKLFGFYGWSIILPQVIAAVASVWLLYLLVRKPFGRAAGVIAALIMALTPVAVAVSRTNNMDSMLVLTLLGAAWFAVKAGEEGQMRWLMASVILIGMGFNVKMLQAFMVLPAIYVCYLLGAKLSFWKKIKHLTAAAVVTAVVSFSWTAVVDAVPPSERPFIGSSTNNTVTELIIGHNGMERILGRGQGLGSTSKDDGNGIAAAAGSVEGPGGRLAGGGSSQDQGAGALPLAQGGADSMTMQPPSGEAPGQMGMQPPAGAGPAGMDGGPAAPGADGGFAGDGGQNGGGARGGAAGGPGGTGEIGTAGALRLFNSSMAGQASWLLPLALIACIALLGDIKGWRTLSARHRAALFWLAWLAPMLVFFSYAGFFHRYYLIMLGPGIAALAGAGLVAMWNDYRSRESGWRQWLLPLALAVTAAVQLVLVWRYTGLRPTLFVAIALFSTAALLLLAAVRRFNPRFGRAAIAAGLIGLLLAPGYWSLTPAMNAGKSAVLPYAGPELSSGMGMGGGGVSGTSSQASPDGLTPYLLSHYTEGSYLVGVQRSTSASSYIITTGLPVMAWGGFQGDDPAITAEELEALAKAGKIKYFLLEGRGMGGGQNEIAQWIQAHAREVPAEEYQGTTAPGTAGASAAGANSQAASTAEPAADRPGEGAPEGQNARRSGAGDRGNAERGGQTMSRSGTLYEYTG